MKKLICVLTALFMLLLMPSAASAHHKVDHEQGQGVEQVETENNGRESAPGQQKKVETTESDKPDAGDNEHPSGKDRSVEPGGSGNQGNAQSDPDDDGKGPDRSNGGADKPGGKGGTDKGDQDANNGCGNDDDFEDDNEGWCGKKPKPEKPEKPREQKPVDKPNKPVDKPEKPKTPVEKPPVVTPPVVTPPVVTPPVVTPPVVGPPEKPETPVFERPEEPARPFVPTPTETIGEPKELAYTGSNAALLLMGAASMMGAGSVLLRKRR